MGDFLRRHRFILTAAAIGLCCATILRVLLPWTGVGADGAVYAAQAARSGEPVLAASRDASVPAAREDVVVARPPRPPIVITPLDPPRRRAARHVARDLRASGYPAGA